MHAQVATVLAVSALLFAPAGLALGPTALAADVAPALAARIAADPAAPVDALVTMASPVKGADLARMSAAGVDPLRVYGAFQVVHVMGEGRDVLSLARMPGVVHVSGNERLHFDLNSATVSTNARQVWDSRSTSTTPVTVGGVVIDGSGVGVAVVDSGVDATHPDLAPAVAANKKWVCSTPSVSIGNDCLGNAAVNALLRQPGSLQFDTTCNNEGWIDVPHSDTTIGHGTHVAGIVAGRGVASAGRHMGAAPGAMIYGLGAGEATMQFALQAFEWVLCHHASVSPPIRVVTNSWSPSSPTGAEIPFNPSDAISMATNKLLDEGIVVVFSAGNEGGNGSVNVVNAYGKNPRGGVINVANYEDSDVGTRTGTLATSSSRGRASETPGEQWPDVSAPGMGILSARAKTGAFGLLGHPLSGDGRFLCCANSNPEDAPEYVGMSGTSMSAPHVAGIVALLLQANPALTPAEVEDILEDTATAIPSAGPTVADPTNPTTPTHHAAGHGLVDALAAVKDPRAGGVGAGSPQPRLDSATLVFVAGAVNPQAVLHAKWVTTAGPTGLAKSSFVSGGTSVTTGDTVRFVVDGGAPLDGIVNASGRARVVANLAPGLHHIETQVLLGGVWRAFDAFDVEAV